VRITLAGLVFSTEDSTMFVFKGKASNTETRYLLQDNGVKNGVFKYNQSVYGHKEGETDHLNVLRVRLTFTMNATCMIAATFITVTGVTERELPRDVCPSGILYIKIPGLCLGAAQDLRHDTVVYVAFYRTERCEVSQSTAEQRKFSFYREHILKPFASKVREDLYGSVKVTPIHDELTAHSNNPAIYLHAS